MKVKTLWVILACMCFTSCAVKPTEKELAEADYGAKPILYEDIIKQFMEMKLKDPGSAEYKFIGNPLPGWNNIDGRHYGYFTCVYINAKNSFGGYTGFKLNYFMINKNVVTSYKGGDGDFDQALIKGMCQSFQ